MTSKPAFRSTDRTLTVATSDGGARLEFCAVLWPLAAAERERTVSVVSRFARALELRECSAPGVRCRLATPGPGRIAIELSGLPRARREGARRVLEAFAHFFSLERAGRAQRCGGAA